MEALCTAVALLIAAYWIRAGRASRARSGSSDGLPVVGVTNLDGNLDDNPDIAVGTTPRRTS